MINYKLTVVQNNLRNKWGCLPRSHGWRAFSQRLELIVLLLPPFFCSVILETASFSPEPSPEFSIFFLHMILHWSTLYPSRISFAFTALSWLAPHVLLLILCSCEPRGFLQIQSPCPLRHIYWISVRMELSLATACFGFAALFRQILLWLAFIDLGWLLFPRYDLYYIFLAVTILSRPFVASIDYRLISTNVAIIIMSVLQTITRHWFSSLIIIAIDPSWWIL